MYGASTEHVRSMYIAGVEWCGRPLRGRLALWLPVGALGAMTFACRKGTGGGLNGVWHRPGGRRKRVSDKKILLF